MSVKIKFAIAVVNFYKFLLKYITLIFLLFVFTHTINIIRDYYEVFIGKRNSTKI